MFLKYVLFICTELVINFIVNFETFFFVLRLLIIKSPMIDSKHVKNFCKIRLSKNYCVFRTNCLCSITELVYPIWWISCGALCISFRYGVK